MATYYISTSGTATNAGTSQSAPWSMDKFISFVKSSGTSMPGNTFLFKRGEIFNGGFQAYNGATATNRVTYGAYGTGDKPIITGFKNILTLDTDTNTTTKGKWKPYSGRSGVYYVSLSNQRCYGPTILTLNSIGGTPELKAKARFPKNDYIAQYNLAGVQYYTTDANGDTVALPAYKFQDRDLGLGSTPWVGAAVLIRGSGQDSARSRISAHDTSTGAITTFTNIQGKYGFQGDQDGFFVHDHLNLFTTTYNPNPQIGEYVWIPDDPSQIDKDLTTCSGKLYIYLGSNPNNYEVRIGKVDIPLISLYQPNSYTTVNGVTQRGYMTVENLIVEGGLTGVFAKNQTDCIVQDCEFRFFETAISLDSTVPGFKALRNSIHDGTFNGVRTSNATTNLLIEGNTIERIGLDLHQTSWDVASTSGCGILIGYNSYQTVRNNKIIDIGYCPIQISGANDTTIEGNFIKNFGLNKNDVGGIYWWTDTAKLASSQNRFVRKNIILNGSDKGGNAPGLNSIQASGIYCDYGNKVVIEDNYIEHMAGFGITLTSAGSNVVRRNIVKDVGYTGPSDGRGAIGIFNGLGKNNTVENNVAFAEAGKGRYYLEFRPGSTSTIQQAVTSSSNNRYFTNNKDSNGVLRGVRTTVEGVRITTFAYIQSLGMEIGSTETLYDPTKVLTSFNETNQPKTVSLGSKTYKNLITNAVVSGSLVLQPNESVALLETTGTSNPPVIPIINPPSIASTVLNAASVTSSSLTLSWSQATTTLSPNTLTYYVYASTANNITTLATAETNGTLVGIVKNSSSFSVTNLEPSATYYFNIIAVDEMGNKSVYAAKSQTTAAAAALMPVPGGNQDTWGTVLNSYLLIAHNNDGTMKAAPIASKVFGTTGTTNIDIASSMRVQQQLTLLSQYNQSLQSTTSSTLTPINFSNGAAKVILTGATTLLLGNAVSGGTYTLILQQDATGGRTITWPVNVKWSGGATPIFASAANAVTVITFVYDGTTFFGKVG
jgi:hypothetical protein